jgi:hypothetical protein
VSHWRLGGPYFFDDPIAYDNFPELSLFKRHSHINNGITKNDIKDYFRCPL